jgi:predicted enzyme related to lactoylglutathione lyase
MGGWIIVARMTSTVRHTTVDCSDPYTLAGFWADVLGASRAQDDFPGDPEALVSAQGTTLLFVTVSETKETKNRVHLDLEPQDRTRDEEVERIVALGASVVADHRRPDGAGWVTLADPEGNEFCIELSATERTALAK